jgi:hypothetical protein
LLFMVQGIPLFIRSLAVLRGVEGVRANPASSHGGA